MNAKLAKRARQAIRIARLRDVGPEWVALVLDAAGLSFKQMRSAVNVVLRRAK
jgi:hypothetical protein